MIHPIRAVGERLGRYAARTGYGRVVRHRDLRLLLGALLVSATGSWAYNVALLAFVYERTGSLAWVSAAGLARFIPMAAVGPYAGVIAARFERIRLMATSDLVCLASQAGLALTPALDGPVGLALVLAPAELTRPPGVHQVPRRHLTLLGHPGGQGIGLPVSSATGRRRPRRSQASTFATSQRQNPQSES